MCSSSQHFVWPFLVLLQESVKLTDKTHKIYIENLAGPMQVDKFNWRTVASWHTYSAETISEQGCSNLSVKKGATGWEWLIRSHSSARFCFQLSGNLN